MNKNDLWVGAYYPDSIFSDPRTKTIMCLLFDKIICNFAVTDMACGGGSGASDFFYSESILVEEEILDIREELLLEDIETNFSEGYFWGTKEEFNRYYDLQITKMALNLCNIENAVPVTDNINMTIPLSLIDGNDLIRFAHLQAAALAIQSLEIVLPNFSYLNEHEILEARFKLRDQLIPFRRSMLMMAPTVRNGINSNATLSDIYNEAKYIVDTKVAPSLDELKEKLQKERGRFWRKLLVKGAFYLPKLAFNWATKGALAASLIGIDDMKDITIGSKSNEIVHVFNSQGGLGFLLKLSEYERFQV